jgi:hypothetical protein
MFFSYVYKKFFLTFCIELKDLNATYTDFGNASWRWPTQNFKRSKNEINGYFSLLSLL